MLSRVKTYFRALTIAGSDSGGGAGIQADLKTFSALGCFGMSAITAITAQNSCAITAIHPLSRELIEEQIAAVANDIGVDAVKIGMLYDQSAIDAVAHFLAASAVPSVFDPVLSAKTGSRLSTSFAALRPLFARVALLTPNLEEASLLLERPIHRREQMEEAALSLQQLGARNVLLKGGHLSETSADCLLQEEGSILWFEKPRLETKNTHGTGCTLSAAIAAFLAQGHLLAEAVRQAKEYLHSALLAGSAYRLGSGHGPLHHFHRFWS